MPVACLGFGCASAKLDPSAHQDAAVGGAGGGGGSGAGGGGASGGSGGKADASTGRDSAPGACDPFTNQGCSSDKKCTALQSGTTLTLGCGSKGAKKEGEDCTPEVQDGAQIGDDCAAGLACFQLEDTRNCYQICASGNGPACPTGKMCNLLVTGLTFCGEVTSCKPLEQGCPGGQACYALQEGAFCLAAGNKSPGSACEQSNECAKGSTCIKEGDKGACSSFCSTATDGTPKCAGASTGGTICTLLPNFPAETNTGSCRNPKS